MTSAVETAAWSASSLAEATLPIKSRSFRETPRVIDAYHDHLVTVVVGAVEEPAGAALSGVDAGEVSAQRFPDSVRVVDQGTAQELDHGRRHRFGQTWFGRRGPRVGQDELVRLVRCGHGQSARTASTPRTTSPRA